MKSKRRKLGIAQSKMYALKDKQGNIISNFDDKVKAAEEFYGAPALPMGRCDNGAKPELGSTKLGRLLQKSRLQYVPATFACVVHDLHGISGAEDFFRCGTLRKDKKLCNAEYVYAE